MEPNLKLFPNGLILLLMASSCNQGPDQNIKMPQNQAIIILDKTNSVSFSKNSAWLTQELAHRFSETYDSVYGCVQCARLTITGDTRVVPYIERFPEKYPQGDGEDRGTQIRREDWENDKHEWMVRQIMKIDSLIDSPNNNNTTDIFSIFEGIQQIQKDNSPWDKVNVYIFSDMINTKQPLNMRRLTMGDALEKGKSICQQMKSIGQLSPKTDNLFLTIYTPDNMEKTDEICQFWKGFFAQWGLPEDHYHFQQSHS